MGLSTNTMILAELHHALGAGAAIVIGSFVFLVLPGLLLRAAISAGRRLAGRENA